jgi:L-fuculose-phosphate aldolase
MDADAVGEVRTSIAQGCRALAAKNLVVGTAGNVSVRAGQHVAITATGATFDELTPDEVVLVDINGSLVAGELEPTSEIELHLALYREFDAGAIVHTHAPGAIAVGLVADELPCIHYQLLSLGGSVRVAPYATFGTRELAENGRAALSGRTAALMANHGAVTYGRDLQAALESTVLLEWACGIYLQAAAVGTPRALSAQQLDDVIAAVLTRNYGTTQPGRKGSAS